MDATWSLIAVAAPSTLLFMKSPIPKVNSKNFSKPLVDPTDQSVSTSKNLKYLNLRVSLKGVDYAFRQLMEEIFGKDIMEAFQKKRPAGYVDLMIAFESRKRGCSPNKLTPLNIALPFSFIDFYKRHKGKDVGMAINKYGDHGIRWVSHGMLRIEVTRMKELFAYPVNKIIEVSLFKKCCI